MLPLLLSKMILYLLNLLILLEPLKYYTNITPLAAESEGWDINAVFTFYFCIIAKSGRHVLLIEDVNQLLHHVRDDMDSEVQGYELWLCYHRLISNCELVRVGGNCNAVFFTLCVTLMKMENISTLNILNINWTIKLLWRKYNNLQNKSLKFILPFRYAVLFSCLY